MAITICVNIYIFILFLGIINCTFFDYFDDNQWSAENSIKRDGYPLEVHNITTEDGYILTVQRIPAKNGAAPVLLQHGLLCDSALWLTLGKNNSLAYQLADEGYDIWLGNVRGNSYGLNHVNLTTDDHEFWDFSYHEMAVFDLPAIINYIKDSTNQSLLYVAHSQGTTMSYIMAIKHPEIANFLKITISLAPVAFQGYTWDVFRQTLIIQIILGLNVFFPKDYPFKFIIRIFCAILSMGQINCLNLIAFIIGYEHSTMFNVDYLPAAIANFPSGTSYKNMYYHSQHVSNNRFAQYDYGETENLKIYNATISPDYDLTKVFVPTALIYVNGNTDVFVQPEDRDRLIQSLPNIVDEYAVNASGFSHMDFMWGKQTRKLVYDHVVKLINQYNNS